MNGYGAIIIGVVASTIVWMSIRFLSRAPMFRHVDDTLGVIYTHGIAGLVGGLLVGLLADSEHGRVLRQGGAPNLPGKRVCSSMAAGRCCVAGRGRRCG